MEEVVIVAAARTAIGKFNGSLAGFSAVELGAKVIRYLLQKYPAITAIDEVIMGQVLTAGAGQNPARQAALNAGLPYETSALTINKVCGSGLKSVQLAAQAIRCGDAEVIIAGGQESMSQAPHVLPRATSSDDPENQELIDTIINDGLWCAFNEYHMGQTAENVAKEYGISRDAQDDFAAESQRKAIEAQQAGRFRDEIVPIEIPQHTGDPLVFDQDEYPRHGTTTEGLSDLRPVFNEAGSVTAGNASGINDGAAVVIVMSLGKAVELGLKPLARIVAYANSGVDPAVMGTGPIFATQKCLAKAGWKVEDLDLIEANEAFSSQAIAVNRELGWSEDRVNVNGGAIALGHPIGASGARILVTLLHEMQHRNSRRGLATLCIGGGQGVALVVERD